MTIESDRLRPLISVSVETLKRGGRGQALLRPPLADLLAARDPKTVISNGASYYGIEHWQTIRTTRHGFR